MKKNHFELKNYVMATGVFILAVIAGILIFFECVQRAVQVNSQNTLKINVQRQSEHLRTILDINYQYLIFQKEQNWRKWSKKHLRR